MDKKKIAYLMAIGAVALVLICVLLAGLLDGHWPWQNDRDMGGGYNGGTTTQATDDDTLNTTGEGTTDASGKPTKPTDEDDDDENSVIIDFDDLVNGKPDPKPTQTPDDGTESTEETTPDATEPNPAEIGIDF